MRTCPSCGTENPDQARFCMSCAAPLGEAPEGVPREVRKTVTVVFADVTGSTALGERLDPESMRQIMTRYFEEMRTALERHGGTVEKFIGDAVMAVFGIPVVHEDDALRAVRAAFDMRRALAALNADLERDWGVDLAARIGVNTGEVVAGDPAAGQTLVTGDAVNVAARLEQAASADEILLGEATHRLVRDAAFVEAVDPITMKGKAERVPAFRLLDVNPEAAGVERRFDSPMVGRDGQLSRLSQTFRAAVEDRACQLFTVLGAAGVGKSRLIQEFLAGLPPDTVVLRGRCLSYGEGITFWPVAEVLREAAGTRDDDPPEEQRARIGALVEGLTEADTITDRLAELIGVGQSSAAPEETFWAVRKLFEHMARRGPLVIVFDDIHWAEPTLLDLIESLADWMKEAPVLLVCPARPELLDRRPGWGGGKFNATSFLLEPLPDQDCALLIDNLLGAAAIPEAARLRILEAAEGTPLFVEEMLSMLIDDGLLRREDGHWEPAGDLSKVRVPPTIQALLAARLDQLGQEERAVVECGSVEGKVFHRGALAVLAPDPVRGGLDTHLRGLTRRELIRPQRAELAGEEAFRFRHQLIRDAAYEGLPKGRRAELHERFADWVEGAAGTAQEYEEIIAYHLEQAYRYRGELGPIGEPERAVAVRAARLLAGAGRRAAARGDMPGEANLLERAVALFPQWDAERLEAVLDESDALWALGEFRKEETLLLDAVGHARALGDAALEMRLRIQATLVKNATDPDAFVVEADDLHRDAVALFERLGDDRGLAAAWELAALRLNMVGHPAAMEDADARAIQHWHRAGDRRQELTAMSRAAGTFFWGRTPVDQGIRRIEEMLEQVKGHPVVEARMHRALSGFLAMQGRFDEARNLLHQAKATCEEFGAKVMLASMSFFTGPLELLAGDPAAAERDLRASCDALEAMGERGWYCSLAGLLAEALYQQGRYDEAYEWTVRSERAGGKWDLEAQADVRAVRAKILARRGDLQAAERLAREAVEIATGTGEIDHEGDAWFDLAEVLTLAGRQEEAAGALREAIERWDGKGNVVSAARARARLTELASRE